MPTPTPTATPTVTGTSDHRYTLTGTADGQPGQGRLVMAFAGGDVNLLKYRISTFEFEGLQGSGTAQFLTIDNTLDMIITLDVPIAGFVLLTGEKRNISENILEIIRDFTVSGEGRTITFTATADN